MRAGRILHACHEGTFVPVHALTYVGVNTVTVRVDTCMHTPARILAEGRVCTTQRLQHVLSNTVAFASAVRPAAEPTEVHITPFISRRYFGCFAY